MRTAVFSWSFPLGEKRYVSHVHYSFGSLFKTFWNILPPYLNQYDAGATSLLLISLPPLRISALQRVSGRQPDFQPSKALDPFDEEFDWNAIEKSPQIDNVEDMYQEKQKSRMNTGWKTGRKNRTVFSWINPEIPCTHRSFTILERCKNTNHKGL